MFKILITSLLVSIAGLSYGQVNLFQKVNLENSTVTWLGKKVTGQHEGTINLSSAEFTHSEKGYITGGTFVMDMNSILCTDMEGEYASDLVGHLSSPDFFNAAEFPTAQLTITEIQDDGFGVYDYSGNLTIKDITHPINFVVTFADGVAKGNLSIDRTLYGIKYGSASFFDNLKDKAIDNLFNLDFNLALQQ